MGRALLASAFLVTHSLAVSLLGAAEPFFEESFTEAVQNPNLTSYSPHFAVSVGVLRRIGSTGPGDRRYLQTIVSDYNRRDFVFEVTFTNQDDIIFFGIGQAERGSPSNEPSGTLNVIIHPVSTVGLVTVRTAVGEVTLGRLFTGGPHRARLEKAGNSLTISIDELFDGQFERDLTATFVDLPRLGPFLTDTSSRLFVCNASGQEWWDDFRVISPPPRTWDCNDNGLDDALDLSGGSSQDSGGDGVPDECQVAKHFFRENFDEPPASASLEGYGPWFSVDGGVIRRPSASDRRDRHYVRTVKSDYNVRDFIFELTFANFRDDIFFMGIGEGASSGGNSEPVNSMHFRTHAFDLAGGFVEVNTDLIHFGFIPNKGPHRARIQKTGSAITFSVDTDYDGTFTPDMSHTIPDLPERARFLNDRNSRLFFGAAGPDVTWDDLLIESPPLQGPDCNGNEVADATDISSGVSRDANADGVPDECQTPHGTFSLSPSGPGCVDLVLENEAPVRGGEVGLAFEPASLLFLGVEPGADFPSGGELRSDVSPTIQCPATPAVRGGLTLGWINATGEHLLLPPGRHRLFRICFDSTLSAPQGGCHTLRFVRCLGVPQAPVRNIATGEDGESLSLFTVNGPACVEPRPMFRRGDGNRDGSYDISDAIVAFVCLFETAACPTCADALDANDDGLVNLSDPIYLLNWRFMDGSAPRAPFAGCGIDPTADELPCEDPSPCP